MNSIVGFARLGIVLKHWRPGMTNREIDALIAEHFMGFMSANAVTGMGTKNDFVFYLPHYSTDIAAAWEVVRVFSTWPWCFTSSGDTFKFDLGYEGERYSAIAETAPMAICLAALKAKGVDVEREV